MREHSQPPPADDRRLADVAPPAGAVFTLHRGTTPLVVSVRHCGRDLPGWLREQLVPRALDVEDTDRHLERLHDAARELGATLITPRHSRYLIDLNRPRDDAPMNPGANNTGLVPRTFFTGEPPYRAAPSPTRPRCRRASRTTGSRTTTHWPPSSRA